MYLIDAYQEFKTWKKVRDVAFEHEELLIQNGFRVDWVGRIYTVINLPEEVITAAPQIQEGFVLMKLRDYDKLFLKLGLAAELVPEMQRIDADGAAAFLLVLCPDRDYVAVWPLIKFVFRMGIAALILRVLYVIGKHNLEFITSVWHKAIDLLM